MISTIMIMIILMYYWLWHFNCILRVTIVIPCYFFYLLYYYSTIDSWMISRTGPTWKRMKQSRELQKTDVIGGPHRSMSTFWTRRRQLMMMIVLFSHFGYYFNKRLLACYCKSVAFEIEVRGHWKVIRSLETALFDRTSYRLTVTVELFYAEYCRECEMWVWGHSRALKTVPFPIRIS